MDKADVDACLDCDVDMVHVFIPTSDIQRINTINKTREEVLSITDEIIRYVREHVDLCMFSAMDATRTDGDYLIEVFRTAAQAGATIINVPDTVGVISPSGMKTLITRIAPRGRLPASMSTATTTSALRLQTPSPQLKSAPRRFR